jgi:hypothetical protein
MMDRIAISSFDAMVYLERKPVVLLCPFIRTIWYAAVPSPSSERVRAGDRESGAGLYCEARRLW